MACQDYFTNFEPSQLVGGAKMGNLQEKTPDHPQAELASLTCDPSKTWTHSSEMTSDLER